MPLASGIQSCIPLASTLHLLKKAEGADAFCLSEAIEQGCLGSLQSKFHHKETGGWGWGAREEAESGEGEASLGHFHFHLFFFFF